MMSQTTLTFSHVKLRGTDGQYGTDDGNGVLAAGSGAGVVRLSLAALLSLLVAVELYPGVDASLLHNRFTLSIYVN